MFVTFDEWTQGRSIASLGTNAGAEELPFQSWRAFKEAFAPELVARAVRDSRIPVRRCVDPFGGSGTTALACQFLGVEPTIVEVNPFLADLIEAKLVQYDADALARDLGAVAGRASTVIEGALNRFSGLPATFLEPGVNDRWIFNQDVATRIATLLNAIDGVETPEHRRLLRVLLGGVLVDVSNVVVSGKGRRYRRGWRERNRPTTSVDDAFFEAARTAICDIHRYANRLEPAYTLIRGDSRVVLSDGQWDLAIFSPPYPNSFDYTDVYNVELWTLGYLNSFEANRLLRQSTLTSHVQISRPGTTPPEGSSLLDAAIVDLVESRRVLWDPRIPEMIGAYFTDLTGVMECIRNHLSPGGSTWLVVGDSRYAGVQIDTAKIIGELARDRGWRVKGIEPFRSMRLSAQQGGHPELAETLIILDRTD